jgi:hypothetical protein
MGVYSIGVDSLPAVYLFVTKSSFLFCASPLRDASARSLACLRWHFYSILHTPESGILTSMTRIASFPWLLCDKPKVVLIAIRAAAPEGALDRAKENGTTFTSLIALCLPPSPSATTSVLGLLTVRPHPDSWRGIQ